MLCCLGHAASVLVMASSVLRCNEWKSHSWQRCIAVLLGPESSLHEGRLPHCTLKIVAVPLWCSCCTST